MEDEQDWHNIYNLLNVKSHNKLTDHIEIHFLELPKFTLKDMRKIRTSEAWLAYFSGRYTKKELEETFLQDKIERRAYEQREKAIRDYYSYMSAYKEEGLEQGLKQGLQQGKLEEKFRTATNLLKMGFDIETISKAVELSREKIQKLSEKNER